MSQVPGEFEPVGREFLGYFRDLGHLLPNQRVLDIGCGPGRMAIPLTTYFSNEGRYEGVDTWTEAVEWCQENITPRFGNFHFRSIENLGPVSASAAASIASETSRLKTGHSSLRSSSPYRGSTNALSAVYERGRQGLRQGGTYLELPSYGRRTGPRKLPSTTGKGYLQQATDRRASRASGLPFDGYRGSWDGDPVGLSYQDIIVAKKGVA